MVEYISRSTPKARKQHRCSAIEDMLSHASRDEVINYTSFTNEEREVMRKAIVDDNCRIRVGEVYECQVCKHDGRIYTYRAKAGVFDIACKYKLLTEAD